MKRLAPSILSADFGKLGEDVSEIEKGGAHIIHVDVMDGHFVPNISFGSTVMKGLLGKTNLPFDVHLMIENPEVYAKDFVTEQTEYITVHYEACPNLKDVIKTIKDLKVKVGLSINPDTKVEQITDYLEEVDLVLIMSVYPGFGGQKIIWEAINKIPILTKLREERKLDFEIEVDGGITIDNVREVVEKGADMIVAGSAIFGKEDITIETKKFVDTLDNEI